MKEMNVLLNIAGGISFRHFQVALVSQTTICVVDDLLNGKRIDLTSYEESIQYHIPLLQAFLKKQNKLRGAESEICLIT